MNTRSDQRGMERAVELGLRAEQEGNPPVGAVITAEGRVVAEGQSRVKTPAIRPERHAVREALADLEDEWLDRTEQLTCHVSLEPCVMCIGTLVNYGVQSLVFGANDPENGATDLLDNSDGEDSSLSSRGPVMADQCVPLRKRAYQVFETLPVGRKPLRRDSMSPRLSTVKQCRKALLRWHDNPNRGDLDIARLATQKLAELLGPDGIDEVVPYARAIFNETGYLKDFRTYERYARRAGHQNYLRDVEKSLRQNLPDIWIERAVDRGELNSAIDCWFENEEHSRIRLCAETLLEACEDDRIELLISCRLSIAEYYIGRRARRHYRRACDVLRKLRDELEKNNHSDYFDYVLEDIRTQYSELPALLDELDRAGF